ncbi:MAG: adenine phosphoribosyltransferase [Armatimonadetes bacterium]|nr:adenine phosphoribosyltransferase [Armatimonadota bacterium]
MADLLAARLIRDVPDFPREGILFKDITPVLQDPKAFREVIDRMLEAAKGRSVDVVIGIESRGFLFAAPLALALGASLVPVRKLGKLPAQTVRAEYALEYGTNTVEMHRDALRPGQRCLIVDDLLATGGTAAAAARLVETLEGTVEGFLFLVELKCLHGRRVLSRYDIQALIPFE